jgi:hypothetical protein
LSDQERKTGWYGPGAEPGSSANVIGGEIVSHQEMLAAYRAEFTTAFLGEQESEGDSQRFPYGRICRQ